MDREILDVLRWAIASLEEVIEGSRGYPSLRRLLSQIACLRGQTLMGALGDTLEWAGRSEAVRQEAEPLPPGWQERLSRTADLSAAYRELEGHPHFFAAAMRGRIRGLQLRRQEALIESLRALNLASGVQAIPRNFLRLVITTYQAGASILLFLRPAEARETLDLLSAVRLESAPLAGISVSDWRSARRFSRATLAALALAAGDNREAFVRYSSIIRSRPEWQAMAHLGQAAAAANLGREPGQYLEAAGLAIHAGRSHFHQALATSILAAFHRAFGNPEAAEWSEFLDRLGCPHETVWSLRRRGEYCIRHFVREKRLVLL